MSDEGRGGLWRRCEALRRERRFAEALDLLEAEGGPAARAQVNYWTWKAALLLDAGRVQEAESSLTSAAIRPEWPTGHPEIARWLGITLLRSGRNEEVVTAVASWAARGDVACEMLRMRAMLRLGKPREVLPKARRVAQSRTMEPDPHLVLLEALLDLQGVDRKAVDDEEPRRVLEIVRNLVKLGVRLDPEQQDRLERLEHRMRGPFGFARKD